MNQTINLPNHIAIIMDGNGRWAKKRGLPRNLGHRQGVQTLNKIARYCSDIGIKHLTVYAFSTENWNRPQKEVDYLLDLLDKNLQGLEKKLSKRQIRLKVIGETNNLSDGLKQTIANIENNSKNNTGMILNIAFNYGSKDELIHVFQKLQQEQMPFTKENVDKYLYTSESKDVDLLIRTSGEMRISNFLLWQIAYSEFYFTDVYWPDFSPKELDKAIMAYNMRERRFGGIKNEK